VHRDLCHSSKDSSDQAQFVQQVSDVAGNLLQADPELEAIRQRRMAELMARQGVSMRQQQMHAAYVLSLQPSPLLKVPPSQ
jgi:hypothetical protein